MIITKIYLIALILMCGSCSNRQTVFTKEADGFDHSCPKRGHGDCFLCDDCKGRFWYDSKGIKGFLPLRSPIKKKNENNNLTNNK